VANRQINKTAEAVLVAHQRFDAGGCLCGWAELGKSHAAHQVRMLAEAGVVAADGAPQECREETHSWRHFTAEQVDSYWIRCTLAVPHDEHKDEHTGLTWVSQAMRDTGSNLPAGDV
jgi:hypothetical protein